jgi:hypothetical protein
MKVLAQRVVTAWNRFFFEPVSTASLGLFRILFGSVILISLIGTYPYRGLFYGENGIVSYSTMSHFFPPGLSLLFFRWLPESDPLLKIYFLGLILCTVCLIAGFCTRTMSVLVFLGIVSLSNRNFFVDNAGDDLMRINCLLLMLTPAGAAYSVDQWLSARRTGDWIPPRLPPWGQRLLQLQLAYLYLDTFILKLPGDGWRDGTALYYALNYIELKRFHFKYLFYYLWQIKLVTYSVEVAELCCATLIWVRRFRYPVLGAAFLLHLGINLTMQFPVFQYVMMASLVNFIYPEDLERWVARIRKRTQGAPVSTKARAAA